jgi:hypothetical protein
MPLAPTIGLYDPGEGYGVLKRPESFDGKDKLFMVFTAVREKK